MADVVLGFGPILHHQNIDEKLLELLVVGLL